MKYEQLFDAMRNDAELINRALDRLYREDDDPALAKIFEAEKYSLRAGGKRIRPILVLAFCRMFGGTDEAAIPYGCALEMIHTASLIHDDLPCIDNDDLRRGRPTNHKVFGEATALLAGDGLLMDAFGVIASNAALPPQINAEAVRTLSRATGTHGIVGGEFIDIQGETEVYDLPTLEKMHVYKTGALIRAAVTLGCLAAGVAPDSEKMQNALIYADSVGLAFQIVDDILDVTGTAEALGKTPGKDAKDGKTTYLSFYTCEEAFRKARALTERAVRAVGEYKGSEFLVCFAEYLLNRKN